MTDATVLRVAAAIGGAKKQNNWRHRPAAPRNDRHATRLHSSHTYAICSCMPRYQHKAQQTFTRLVDVDASCLLQVRSDYSLAGTTTIQSGIVMPGQDRALVHFTGAVPEAGLP